MIKHMISYMKQVEQIIINSFKVLDNQSCLLRQLLGNNNSTLLIQNLAKDIS